MPLVYLGMVCLAASLASFAIKCTLWTAKVILKVNYIWIKNDLNYNIYHIKNGR